MCALLGLAVGGDGAVGLWIFAASWGLLLGLNVAAGATCACYVQTAVQVQRLHSLSRLRGARRILKQLNPLITAAQGEVSREELARHLD